MLYGYPYRTVADLKTDINGRKETAVDGRIYGCTCARFLTVFFEPNAR